MPPEPSSSQLSVVARVSSCSKAWPDGTQALDSIDGELRPGQVTALVGPNGAGKTTLLRILAGVIEPSSGTVEYLGQGPPSSSSAKAERRARTGYISQHHQLDPEMTVWETLRLLAAMHAMPPAARRERSERLAVQFGLASYLGRRVQHLSGGLRQRLHLACGLLHDPDLLALDEPFRGLDASSGNTLWQELRQRAQAGAAITLVSHDLSAVERFADQVWVLATGKLLQAATPAELISRYGRHTIEATYDQSPSATEVDRALGEWVDRCNIARQSTQVVLELPPDLSTESALLTRLAQLSPRLLSLRSQPPNLSGAVETLAGERLRAGDERNRPSQRGRRRSKRGQERRR